MTGGDNLDFTSLRKGLVLGPEHHPFRLVKPVSNSPIGQVWHALDLSTETDTRDPDPVAIEIVNPKLVTSKQTLHAFKEQVTHCKQLNHKHVAQTYGYFVSREGWLFVAMELFSTRSLARILMEDGYQQLNVDKSRVILSQVAVALDHAHKQRITHGDLTPWNIIITPDAGVKLVNFAFRQPLFQQIQKQGHRVINGEYHAPEAFDHIPLSTSSDIFSFGCLIYQLLCGTPPFGHEQPRGDLDSEQLPQPPQLSDEQWSLLKSALSDNPGDRPAIALKLLKDLFKKTDAGPSKNPVADTGTAAPTPSPTGRTTDRPRKHPAPPSPPSAAAAGTPASGAAEAAPHKGLPETLPQHAGQFWPKRSAQPQPQTAPPQKSSRAALLLTASVTFILGIALGYVITTRELNNKHMTIMGKLTAVHEILARAPSTDNKVKLQVVFAELATLSNDQNMLVQLNKQVSQYVTRLEDRAQPAQARANEQLALHGHIPVDTNALKDHLEDPNGFRAGAVFKDELRPGVFGPNMVVLPAGSFRMGDLDKNGDDNEKPIHRVIISRPFALSQHEVTFAQYDYFALTTGRPLPDDNGWGRGKQPVINVSWNEANAYADWLQEQTGLPYRLPSEAEWEYAARGKTESAYWWGDQIEQNRAVCYDCGSSYDGKQPAPVGSFPANPFGLFDINGNVYEWVGDCYNDTYIEAPTDGSTWSTGQCRLRVMRGGSWYDIGRLARSASRYRHPPSATRNAWGFRLALDLH